MTQFKPKRAKTGGRKIGSVNKVIKAKRYGLAAAETIAQKDRSGRSMAVIQIDAARFLEKTGHEELAREKPDLDRATRFIAMAAKVAKDVSPYLYSTHQAIKHSGDEDAPPIRFETLSDFQLEQLVKRLQRG